MRWLSRPIMLATLLAGLAAGTASALQADEEKPTLKPAASAAEIARWLNDLSSRDFATREQASRRLADAGEAAIEPVAQLSDTDNLELAMRGLFILKEQMQSNQPVVKEAAKKALEKLAASSRGSVSKRAQAILNPPADNPIPSRVNPGALQLRFAPGIAGGVRNLSVSSRTVNGHTEMTITEDSTKVAISHTNGREIVVKITDPPKDGKEQPTKEFTAKDTDELKKKHPEAHKYFERYTGWKNLIPAERIPLIGPLANQVKDNAIAGVPAPVAASGVRKPLDLEQLQKTLQEIESAQQELQQLSERLQALAANKSTDPDAIKKLAEEIRSASERIKTARLKLLP